MTIMGTKLDEDEPTDLARMWDDASIQYYNTTEMRAIDLKHFKNADEILADRDIQKNFLKVSHPCFTLHVMS
jgi:hypothetical protein